jgi:hypothetical protein
MIIWYTFLYLYQKSIVVHIHWTRQGMIVDDGASMEALAFPAAFIGISPGLRLFAQRSQIGTKKKA